MNILRNAFAKRLFPSHGACGDDPPGCRSKVSDIHGALAARPAQMPAMHPDEPTAQNITSALLEKDLFSQWMGLEVLSVRPGQAVLRMTVRQEMVNGFGIAHGGITFSLADSALAFAANSHGRLAFSIDTAISHVSAVRVQDILTATAEERHRSHRIGLYDVRVTDQDDRPVAFFKGTVYFKSDRWPMPPHPPE
jgi:acyl-CoA thioesterase